MATRQLDRLLADLAGEGRLDSAGAFTMDPVKAREKLAQRQLREAGLWLTKLIQGAHLWEARSLCLQAEMTCTRAQLRLPCYLDLRPWLERLHEVEMMADLVYGPLAMAFQAALADGCDYVQLLPGSLRLDGGPLRGEVPRPQEVYQFVFHSASRRRWWQFGLPPRIQENFQAASRRASFALPKVEMYQFPVKGGLLALQARPVARCLERVWVSPAPARELMHYPTMDGGMAEVEEVDGRLCLVRPKARQTLRQWRCETASALPLPPGALDDWWKSLCQSQRARAVPVEQSGLAVRGVIRWEVEDTTPARLVPVRNGIELEAMPVTTLPTGVNIWFSCSQWCTDLNQKRVVQDACSKQIAEWCTDQFEAMVASLQELLRASDRPESLDVLWGGLNARLQARPLNSRGLPFPQLVD